MSTLVVDCSVAIKWFVPEPLSGQADRLLDGARDLLAPDLIFPELGNVLWKKVARRELSPAEARDVLSGLQRVPLVVEPSRALTAAALEIALVHGRTVYDAVYVALAVAHDCTLVTADDRLVRTLAVGPLARHVRSLAALEPSPGGG